MLSQQQFSDLIGMIYDAASTPQLWLRFLEGASALLGAHMSNLILLDAGHPASAIVRSYGTAPDRQAEFERRAHQDYWVEGGKQLPSGTVALGSEIISIEDMHKTAFYREFASHDDAEYMLGAVIENSPERQAFVSFVRGQTKGNFDARHKQDLVMLMPHIQRAYYIHLQLANKDPMEKALDSSSYGVILLDCTGTTVFVNQQAREFLVEQDGMTMRYGELKLYEYSDQLELDNYLSHAQKHDGTNSGGSSGMLAVRRPSGKLPYQITISPISDHPSAMNFTSAAAYLLNIHDPTLAPSLSRNMLKTAYGLTDAEAMLCERLYRGDTLDGAAGNIGISRNTAKTHLKHIFEKCEVNSQPALMRLLGLGLKG